MFELRIEGLAGANALAGWPTHTVSVINAGIMQSSGSNHLVVEFRDVEAPWILACPVRSDMDRILEFTKDLKDGDRLLVHCHAGVRRSPAVAIGIMVQHGMEPADAFDHVFKVRPVMVPNRLILKLMDAALDKNWALETYGKRWVAEAMRSPTGEGTLGFKPRDDGKAVVNEMQRLLDLTQAK